MLASLSMGGGRSLSRYFPLQEEADEDLYGE